MARCWMNEWMNRKLFEWLEKNWDTSVPYLLLLDNKPARPVYLSQQNFLSVSFPDPELTCLVWYGMVRYGRKG